MTESQASEDRGEKVQTKAPMFKMSLLILKKKDNQCFPALGQGGWQTKEEMAQDEIQEVRESEDFENGSKEF